MPLALSFNRRSALALAVLGGLTLGLVGFTFRFSEGLSYLSSDPKACANCHIMNDQFSSWTKAPHHGVAGCVDCHLPHELVPKYQAKVSNGYHHSKGFTFQDFHEPIMIKPHNAAILQRNCLRCHGEFVHEILTRTDGPEETGLCVHCHRNVGHGARD